jgi:hypothetical protein
MKFRKKPVVIDAVQFNPTRPAKMGDAFEGFPVEWDERGVFVIIPTLEGKHRCDSGDWLITGIKGEKYPCKPDIFAATYEHA